MCIHAVTIKLFLTENRGMWMAIAGEVKPIQICYQMKLRENCGFLVAGFYFPYLRLYS